MYFKQYILLQYLSFAHFFKNCSISFVMHVLEDGQKSGENMYEEEYVYNIRCS
jgi:hypothetical protein